MSEIWGLTSMVVFVLVMVGVVVTGVAFAVARKLQRNSNTNTRFGRSPPTKDRCALVPRLSAL
jgi:heme/copper-type cytochrome/quinol oxidase subunit 2